MEKNESSPYFLSIWLYIILVKQKEKNPLHKKYKKGGIIMGRFLEGLMDVLEVVADGINETAEKRLKVIDDTADLFLRITEYNTNKDTIENKMKQQMMVFEPYDRRGFLEAIERKTNEKKCYREMLVNDIARKLKKSL